MDEAQNQRNDIMVRMVVSFILFGPMFTVLVLVTHVYTQRNSHSNPLQVTDGLVSGHPQLGGSFVGLGECTHEEATIVFAFLPLPLSFPSRPLILLCQFCLVYEVSGATLLSLSYD